MQVLDLAHVTENVPYEGLVFIQSYQKKLDDSRRPLNGVLFHQGATLNFKIWDKSLQDILNNNDFNGKIAHVTGTGGSYNGVKDITINSLNFSHGFTDITAFLKSVNIEEKFQQFATFINANISQNGVALISELFGRENLYEPFKTAWAAKKMHDAQVGGLMNHTTKMLNIAKTLVDNDPRLVPYKDILYVGIILHDIGKVVELDHMGNYTKDSVNGHRTIGVEYVVRNKDLFITHFDQMFYMHILEIITGHHGEQYGDAPKTAWSYISHLIDMLDSQLTGILDQIEVNNVTDYNGNKAVWNHGNNLVI